MIKFDQSIIDNVLCLYRYNNYRCSDKRAQTARVVEMSVLLKYIVLTKFFVVHHTRQDFFFLFCSVSSRFCP